jgi:hypothetical protein
VRRLPLCYLTPFLVLSANIIITFTVEGNIGYGSFICFVDGTIQNIVTFIVPLITTCIGNTVMFILTVVSINVDKNISKSTQSKSEFLIFVKLFSLTGIVWVLQVVDGFVTISVFSFVVTILTSSQGIFILLSFATSSRVLNYINCCITREHPITTGERNPTNRVNTRTIS